MREVGALGRWRSRGTGTDPFQNSQKARSQPVRVGLSLCLRTYHECAVFPHSADIRISRPLFKEQNVPKFA